MKKHYYSNNQYSITQFRSNQTPLEILNNLPGYNYNLPTKEELKNAIYKKYGFAPYPSHTSIEAMKISSYSNETFEMSMSLMRKMDQVKSDRVSLMIPDKDEYKVSQFQYKINSLPNLMDKADIFREHLKTFDEKKSEYIKMMSRCTEMTEADEIANTLFNYHDSTIGDLYVESQLALQQFKIDLSGCIPNPD